MILNDFTLKFQTRIYPFCYYNDTSMQMNILGSYTNNLFTDEDDSDGESNRSMKMKIKLKGKTKSTPSRKRKQRKYISDDEDYEED